jgi:hypothetical protein
MLRKATGPQDEENRQFGQRRTDEPAGPDQVGVGLEDLKENGEGEQVKRQRWRPLWLPLTLFPAIGSSSS